MHRVFLGACAAVLLSAGARAQTLQGVVSDGESGAPLPGDYEIVEVGAGIAVFAAFPLCKFDSANIAVDIFLNGSSRARAGSSAPSLRFCFSYRSPYCLGACWSAGWMRYTAANQR